LGWGGFWFWDPLKTHFMLMAAALPYPAIVVEKREKPKGVDNPAGDPCIRIRCLEHLSCDPACLSIGPAFKTTPNAVCSSS
jgi:hypothetical protein